MSAELVFRTGEVITVVRSGTGNGGESLEVEAVLPPGVSGPPAHLHTRETETFSVLDGRLWVRSGRRRLVLGEGETAIVPPETVHTFANRSDVPVRFRTVSSPAGILEQMLRLRSATGRTPVLRIALLNQGRDQTLFFPGLPRSAQRMMWNTLAGLARRRHGDGWTEEGARGPAPRRQGDG